MKNTPLLLDNFDRFSRVSLPMEEDQNWTGEYRGYSGDNSDSHEYTIMEEDPKWTGEYPHYSGDDSSLSDDFQ